MVDQEDARQNSEAVETDDVAIKIRPFPRYGNMMGCSGWDEEIRLAYNKRVKNSQKPSMWEYNSEGGMPIELANLDPSTFLTSRQGQRLCFLPKDVLARICSKLSVCDFVNFSMTCRFLHWRMFTFCTCYAPYTVIIRARYDENFTDFWDTNWDPLNWVNSGFLDDNLDGFFHLLHSNEVVVIREPLVEVNRQRGFFVCQQLCLRKPFFFDTLEVQLIFPSYCKKYYDMCLPYIMTVRGLARHLDLAFINQDSPENRIFNYPETNDFLVAVNASFYSSVDRRNIGRIDNFISPFCVNKDIYINCSYARQMYIVVIANDIIDVPVFENPIGAYFDPLDLPIIATLKNFLTGSTNLVFHQYRHIENHDGRFPLIEYLFQQFGEFEEFFYAQRYRKPYYDYNTWKKVVGTENGGQLRIFIAKCVDRIDGRVIIGKEEIFDEMDNKYSWQPLYNDSNIWLRMETAMELDEIEDAKKAVELDEVVFQNEIGVYWYHPRDTAIKTTLRNFLNGSMNLVFHQYLNIERHNGGYPLVEYLFQQFGEFEEFWYEYESWPYEYYHIWEKVVETENGGQLRIMIIKDPYYQISVGFPYAYARNTNIEVIIGKDEMFDEMNRKYARRDRDFRGIRFDPDNGFWWNMETAVEPDEAEEEQGVISACCCSII